MLSEIMGRHRITQAALAKASNVRPGSIGALYHEQTYAISLSMLASVLHGLEQLTGVPYHAGDLLKVVPQTERKEAARCG